MSSLIAALSLFLSLSLSLGGGGTQCYGINVDKQKNTDNIYIALGQI